MVVNNVVVSIVLYADRELLEVFMKKVIVVACLALVFAAVASSCTHHTCPAYRGSIAEAVE